MNRCSYYTLGDYRTARAFRLVQAQSARREQGRHSLWHRYRQHQLADARVERGAQLNQGVCRLS